MAVYSGSLKWRVSSSTQSNEHQILTASVQNSFKQLLQTAYGQNLKNVYFSPNPVYIDGFYKINFTYEVQESGTTQGFGFVGSLLTFIANNTGLVLSIFAALTIVSLVVITLATGGSAQIDLSNGKITVNPPGSGGSNDVSPPSDGYYESPSSSSNMWFWLIIVGVIAFILWKRS